MSRNIDDQVVRDFGREWSQFDQSEVPAEQLYRTFQQYFSMFRWDKLPKSSKGFDLGCGSGRWAYFCAPRSGELHCIDPSEAALEVAKNKLSGINNCFFHLASVDAIPLDDDSMDFGYSLGVLHHVPDTASGVRSCVKKLKPNAPFLLYLYYAFDNRSFWFKTIWRISDVIRRTISVSPYPIKYAASQGISLLVYFPLARFARAFERLGFDVSNCPLSFYRDKDFYTMRTDALDRFGTRLEKRFTRTQIEKMMLESGLERIEFSEKEPFWCAIGYKSAQEDAAGNA
jgi:SAM-dependent methyltransferase